MVSITDMRELLYTLFLIAGFSVYGLYAPSIPRVPISTITPDTMVAPIGVPLVANPVVSISVPAHNVFAQ